MRIVIPDGASPEGETIAEMAEYLVAGLLHVAPATLIARPGVHDKQVVWCLEKDDATIELHRTKAMIFRTYLAYIGRAFMDGQLYGGEAKQELEHLGRLYLATFKMGNSGQTGFWVEIEARLIG